MPMDKWKAARSPNYETNKNKLYPYSELPFESEYKLLKIPFCVKNLINHVDYWGEGRTELDTGNTGFPNCYNINYGYSLVGSGPDKGRKIPNRIPLKWGERIISTFNYIKDNSVLLVTISSHWALNQNIAEDIARLVNSDKGKVIIYGFNDEQTEILSEELKKAKQLFYCPIYLLPDNLQLSHWKASFKAFLNINELKSELYKNINNGDFEAAIILTGCLSTTYAGGALGDVVNKLLDNNVGNVMVYAYKLWNNGNKDVVRKHFPSVFQQIFDGNCMAIINKQNNQALVLEPKTTQAQGDGHYKSGNKLGWKIIPIWDDDDNVVLFKLYNIDSDMYLQLAPTAGEDGVRKACGSKDSKELCDKFHLKPLIIVNGQVAFNIYNCDDDEQLQSSELPVDIDVDSSEVNAVLEPKGVGNKKDESSCWILTTSSQVKKSVKKSELDQSFDEDVISNIYDYD